MLRKWQQECVEAALRKYRNGQHHFLALASPGAGKSLMASELAKQMIEADMVDLVLCFSPSLTIAEGIQQTFSWRLGCSFNGGLGAIGASYTYQNMLYLTEVFWSALKRNRVLVVFDEAHHCGGSSVEDANAWGEEILTQVQEHATYTLALTGTPWRSDRTPIVLSRYSDPEGEIVCDYVYGLGLAIKDKVCRAPKVVLVDSQSITVTGDGKKKEFESIAEFLKNSVHTYQLVITNDNAMRHVLSLGVNKLANIRQQNPRAGGLVVASSVEHARCLQQILVNEFQQSTVIVTYKHDEPLREIAHFRDSATQWIVSVGMVSEGTDIPRLQVCCHLSSIKTELYFRQVLGRVQRITDEPNQEAWLFTIAEEQLTRFAKRVNDDLPEGYSIYAATDSDEYCFTESLSALSNSERERESESGMSDYVDFEVLTSGGVASEAVANALSVKQFRERVINAFMWNRPDLN